MASRRRVRSARQCLEILHKYAHHAPENLVHKVRFLQAEFVPFKGDLADSLATYEMERQFAEREVTRVNDRTFGYFAL
jgi:hypothetical protein